jgi:hypothetical protein
MRSIVGLSGLALTALAAWPSAANAAAPTLCKPDELVVFSCPTGAHTASICASRNISKSDGAMQYRYGRKDSLDLVYPDAATRPVDVFASGTMAFSGGGGAYLRFSKGPYIYTIFTAIGKWGPGGIVAPASGVAVEKDGKEFANFPCRAGGTDGELGPDFFEKLGLKAADTGQDFEIPQAFMPK